MAVQQITHKKITKFDTSNPNYKETPKPKQEAAEDRNKKRKAAAPVKQAASNKSKSEDDFLGLSDEDFMKKYAVR